MSMSPAAPGTVASARISRPHRLILAAVRFGLPLAILLALWLPYFLHFHIDRSPVTPALAEQARSKPDIAVLKEIAELAFAVDLSVPEAQIVQTAEQALTGRVELPAYLNTPLQLTGFPADIELGPPTFRLAMNSLGMEDLLLKAYERTRDTRFLNAARDRVRAFARYEAAQRHSSDFLWNDHAVASRVAVVTRLWAYLRDDPTQPADDAQTWLSLIARSGRLLAKPDQFTVRTNHGVMQNLALMQIGAAFPMLPEAAAWCRLGLERLALQLPFYVSSEGVVLEHSAEYHYFGTQLLAQAIRLSALNGIPPSPALVEASRRSRATLATLVRPDGSLPLIGNTSAGTSIEQPDVPDDGSAPVQARHAPFPSPKAGSSLYPLSGYAIWWNGNPDNPTSQTVTAWAKHDGHGHKHADEGSVVFWAHGSDWITATGYWPYGFAMMDNAYGWSGSNAPHFPHEGAKSPRSVSLQAVGDRDGVRFLDLARHTESGEDFRRQIVQLDPETLLVLDFANSAQGVETIWTLPPSLKLEKHSAEGSYRSSANPDGHRLSISRTSQSAETAVIRHGSEVPFAGWVVNNGKPAPSDALHIIGKAHDSTAATLFAVRKGDSPPAMIHFLGSPKPDRWALDIKASDGTLISLHSTTTQLTVEKPDHATVSVTLASSAKMDAEKSALKANYTKATTEYPPWRDLSPYMLKLTYLFVGMAIALEMAWQIWARKLSPSPRLSTAVHGLLAGLWLAAGLWAFTAYLH